MEGFFVRAKNQFRVVVSVDLLRKSVAVEVDLADVELMNSDARTLRPAMFVTRQTA
jgi:hypothetical protein